MSLMSQIETAPALVKTGVDVVAATTAVGALLGFLPGITAAVGLIWYGILIYDRFFKR